MKRSRRRRDLRHSSRSAEAVGAMDDRALGGSRGPRHRRRVPSVGDVRPGDGARRAAVHLRRTAPDHDVGLDRAVSQPPVRRCGRDAVGGRGGSCPGARGARRHSLRGPWLAVRTDLGDQPVARPHPRPGSDLVAASAEDAFGQRLALGGRGDCADTVGCCREGSWEVHRSAAASNTWTSVVTFFLDILVTVFVPWLLLAGGVPVRRLVPGAALYALVLLGMRPAAEAFLPRALEESAARYGSIGVAFTYLAWLYVVSLLFLATAIIGNAVAEDQGRLGGFIRHGAPTRPDSRTSRARPPARQRRPNRRPSPNRHHIPENRQPGASIAEEILHATQTRRSTSRARGAPRRPGLRATLADDQIHSKRVTRDQWRRSTISDNLMRLTSPDLTSNNPDTKGVPMSTTALPTTPSIGERSERGEGARSRSPPHHTPTGSLTPEIMTRLICSSSRTRLGNLTWFRFGMAG